ncbi:hypothetical protein BDW74DRAFT_174796 [Aspergillus multicolor]|uniref:uncharacterized protein n=1 Tax=Aspergillus multicolor TaxID=41759 RepID=UPI003CCD7377
MSGLEIAGIVLGAIPLAIAAIEIYRQRQNRIPFRKKAPFIARLLSILDTQQFLLIDPAIFKDPMVAGAVDEYLAENAPAYYGAIVECHRALAELVASIEGFDPIPKSLADLVQTYPSHNGVYELPKRIRFPIKLDALEGRIHHLDQSTTRLRWTRENIASLRVQVVQQPTRRIASLASALNMIRNHANRLYSAIATAYPTHCHRQHEARLLLRSNCDVLERKRAAGAKADLSFTVLFSPVISAPSPIPSYRSRITVTESVDVVGIKTQTASNKRVVIAAPAASASSLPRSALNDICKSIREARDGGLMLDLHLTEKKYLMYTHIHGSGSGGSMHLTVESEGYVSLKELLDDKSVTSWLPNPKLALSLTVVSSLLQLMTTPWLCAPLTNKSVRFSRKEVYVASLNLSAIPEPFVEERFCQTANTAKGTPVLQCQRMHAGARHPPPRDSPLDDDRRVSGPPTK